MEEIIGPNTPSNWLKKSDKGVQCGPVRITSTKRPESWASIQCTAPDRRYRVFSLRSVTGVHVEWAWGEICSKLLSCCWYTYWLTNGQDIMDGKGDGGSGETLKLGHYHGPSTLNSKAIWRRQWRTHQNIECLKGGLGQLCPKLI